MQLYTVDRANRTLPLVRRIVEDIVREHARWQDAIGRLDLLLATNTDTVDLRVAALEREVQTIARDIDGFQAELDALDIQLKDRRLGLVDYPSGMGGRTVLLCWRLGEPEVQFWHEVDAGYAGRQPLTPALAES
jgi:hypothetical protein